MPIKHNRKKKESQKRSSQKQRTSTSTSTSTESTESTESTPKCYTMLVCISRTAHLQNHSSFHHNMTKRHTITILVLLYRLGQIKIFTHTRREGQFKELRTSTCTLALGTWLRGVVWSIRRHCISFLVSFGFVSFGFSWFRSFAFVLVGLTSCCKCYCYNRLHQPAYLWHMATVAWINKQQQQQQQRTTRSSGLMCFAASMRNPEMPMPMRSVRYAAMRSRTLSRSVLRSVNPVSQPAFKSRGSVHELSGRSQWKSVGPIYLFIVHNTNTKDKKRQRQRREKKRKDQRQRRENKGRK